MLTTQRSKQTNKQTYEKQTKKPNNTNRLRNKKTCMCIVLILDNEKKLMKFAAVLA